MECEHKNIDWQEVPEFFGDATNPPEPGYWTGKCEICGHDFVSFIDPTVMGWVIPEEEELSEEDEEFIND